MIDVQKHDDGARLNGKRVLTSTQKESSTDSQVLSKVPFSK